MSSRSLAYEENPYQLGSYWDRVDSESDYEIPKKHESNLASIVKIGGGSGIYIGKHAGKHIVLTNHHVCLGGNVCSKGSWVQFYVKKLWPKVKAYHGSWKEVDLAILEIDVPKKQEHLYQTIKTRINFEKLDKSSKLYVAGFGAFFNKARVLTYSNTSDQDCKVISDNHRKIEDPDEKNKFPYKVWSFAHGCDISHGDSGSAVFSSESHEIVGLTWTGKTPKAKYYQNSDNLSQLLNAPSPAVWRELSYAVPMFQIKAALVKSLNSPHITSAQREIILSITGQ